jgi:outer membrane protein TolC
MNIFKTTQPQSAQWPLTVVTFAILLAAFVLPGMAQQIQNTVQQPPEQTSQHTTQHKAEGQAGGMSLASLVEAALAANPELTAMRREFDAARARIPQAKALPD